MRYLEQQKSFQNALKGTLQCFLPHSKSIISIQVSDIKEFAQLEHIPKFVFPLQAGLIC